MNSRRSFFSRIAKAVVIASTAPIILRNAIALELPSVRKTKGIMEMLNECEQMHPPLLLPDGRLDLHKIFELMYAIKKHRQEHPYRGPQIALNQFGFPII